MQAIKVVAAEVGELKKRVDILEADKAERSKLLESAREKLGSKAGLLDNLFGKKTDEGKK